MTTRIGINGFGRIGRDYLRFVHAADDVEVVAINDVTNSAALARLRYDSTFGPFGHDIEDLGDGPPQAPTWAAA
jgi:glyceraldehyde 3-phosphate dehydrogenase